MSNVVVAGGSGKAGQAALREVSAHGHQVVNVDVPLPPKRARSDALLRACLTTHGSNQRALTRPARR